MATLDLTGKEARMAKPKPTLTGEHLEAVLKSAGVLLKIMKLQQEYEQIRRRNPNAPAIEFFAKGLDWKKERKNVAGRAKMRAVAVQQGAKEKQIKRFDTILKRKGDRRGRIVEKERARPR
jgi:hypothetical protein